MRCVSSAGSYSERSHVFCHEKTRLDEPGFLLSSMQLELLFYGFNGNLQLGSA
jgi:hypothetical protein